MRMNIVKILHKYCIWMLPLFYKCVGRNRIMGGRFGKEIMLTIVNLYKNNVEFIYGNNNRISIGDGSILEHSHVRVKGNNNSIQFGNNCYLNGLIINIEGDGNSIIFGDNAFVMGDTRIYVVDGSSFRMGDGCMLSDRIEIRTTDNHSIIDRKTGKRINYEKDVVLHDKVWLGTGVTLLKGTELAEGCIVGAASCVTGKHMKPHSVIAGNPAQEIKGDINWLMKRI